MAFARTAYTRPTQTSWIRNRESEGPRETGSTLLDPNRSGATEYRFRKVLSENDLRKRIVVGLLVLVVFFFLTATLVPVEDQARGQGTLELTQPAVRLTFPASSRIAEWLPSEGAVVGAGTPIGRLDLPDLQTRLTQADIRITRLNEEIRLFDLARDPVGLSERRRLLAEAEAARGELRDLSRRAILVSPIAGLISKNATVGETIEAGRAIAVIRPLGATLLFEGRVPAVQATHILPGQPATVELEGVRPLETHVLKATVLAVSPFVTEDRQVRIQLGLSEPPAGEIVGHPGRFQVTIGRRSLLSWLTQRK